MADDVNFNLDTDALSIPISVGIGSGGFIDSLRDWSGNTINNIRSGNDEAMTGIFLTLMFAATVIFLWRKV